MTVQSSLNVDGVWYKITKQHMNVDGIWREIKTTWKKIGDVWKQVFKGYTYEWLIGCWSSCSASCGTGTQTRSVQLLRSDGQIIPESHPNYLSMSPSPKPSISKVCSDNDCFNMIPGALRIDQVPSSQWESSCPLLDLNTFLNSNITSWAYVKACWMYDKWGLPDGWFTSESKSNYNGGNFQAQNPPYASGVIQSNKVFHTYGTEPVRPDVLPDIAFIMKSQNFIADGLTGVTLRGATNVPKYRYSTVTMKNVKDDGTYIRELEYHPEGLGSTSYLDANNRLWKRGKYQGTYIFKSRNIDSTNNDSATLYCKMKCYRLIG